MRGEEVVAVAAMMLELLSDNPVLVADHLLTFIIQDDKSETILFMGKILIFLVNLYSSRVIKYVTFVNC